MLTGGGGIDRITTEYFDFALRFHRAVATRPATELRSEKIHNGSARYETDRSSFGPDTLGLESAIVWFVDCPILPNGAHIIVGLLAALLRGFNPGV